MFIFRAVGKALRLFAEEFVSLLLIGAVGGLLMLLIVTIPFTLGGYAATADDLLRGRLVGVRQWFRGALEMWLLAYGWAILLVVGIITLVPAWFFYASVERIGMVLQALVLALGFIWFGMLAYALPLLRRREPGESWRTTYRRALVLLATRPLDIMLALIFLVTLAAPLYLLIPGLLIYMPLITIILVAVLAHLHPLMPEQEEYPAEPE